MTTTDFVGVAAWQASSDDYPIGNNDDETYGIIAGVWMVMRLRFVRK